MSVSRSKKKLCISDAEIFFSTKAVILSLYRIVENLQHVELSVSTLLASGCMSDFTSLYSVTGNSVAYFYLNMMVMVQDKASVHHTENKSYVAGQRSFCYEYKKDLYDHKEVFLLDVLVWLLLSSYIIQ